MSNLIKDFLQSGKALIDWKAREKIPQSWHKPYEESDVTHCEFHNVSDRVFFNKYHFHLERVVILKTEDYQKLQSELDEVKAKLASISKHIFTDDCGGVHLDHDFYVKNPECLKLYGNDVIKLIKD